MVKYLVDVKWNVSKNVKILVTKKNFFSRKNFDLSCANSNYLKIKENRDLINNILPSKPYYMKQVHGNKVISLEDKGKFSHVCDGLITRKKNQVISILTADCMPIVISSTCGSIVCALHVGRKGAQYNIIGNALQILNQYNYVYEAWIGPAISKKYYLVDYNIRNLFVDYNSNYSIFFNESIENNTLFNMDLVGIASYQLKNNGVNKISFSELCTVENYKDYYSYRYKLDKKRFGTFVWFE
tara:strand:- start:197 stop:919 length:723 start_codon:yes stop_codon:yes gene_type:complete